MNVPKLTNLAWLMSHVERVLPEGGDWCTCEKAQVLASLVIALRPRLVVEIGVWMGGSFIPMAIAGAEVANATKQIVRMLAIDAWSSAASVVGQDDKNAKWWGETNHDQAYDAFKRRVAKLEADQPRESSMSIQIARMPSDLYPAETLDRIDLLHVDGNHGEQALRDAQRFAPRVRVGGIAVFDDVAWEGGHVSKAVAFCEEVCGFEVMYPLDTSVVMQRVRA